MIQFSLTTISWEAVAAIATFAAVVVALVPVGQQARRRKAHAINLRIRLGSKLTKLRPSLEAIIHKDASAPGVLSKVEFGETVRSIENLLKESFVLTSNEQDRINGVFLNLELSAPPYGSSKLGADTAKFVLGG